MNRTALTSALSPLIGFRAGLLEGATDLDTLSNTSTNTYVDEHPLLETDRIFRSCKPIDQENFAGWLATKKADAISKTVTLIDGAMQAAGLMPLLARSAGLLCESVNGQRIEKKLLRRAGICLTPLQEDVLLTITRVRFSLSLPINTTLYLYEAFTVDDIAHFDLTQTLTQQWHDVADFPKMEIGKQYWLLYDEDSLTEPDTFQEVYAMNTIIARPVSNASGCIGCAHKQLSEYIRIEGVTVDNFGRADIVANTNFGLNLTVKAEGDTSDRLLRQPLILLPLYAAQLQVTLLKAIAFSQRKNGTADEDTMGARFVLFDSDNKFAAGGDVDKELKKLIDRLTSDTNVAILDKDNYIEADSI